MRLPNVCSTKKNLIEYSFHVSQEICFYYVCHRSFEFLPLTRRKNLFQLVMAQTSNQMRH